MTTFPDFSTASLRDTDGPDARAADRKSVV